MSSLSLSLVLYRAFTLTWRLDVDDYANGCRRFASLMVLPALFAFVQYCIRSSPWGGKSLSLGPLLPRALLTQGYIYEGSTDFWVTCNRPNGLLEFR
jgi:hypothetical protein